MYIVPSVIVCKYPPPVIVPFTLSNDESKSLNIIPSLSSSGTTNLYDVFTIVSSSFDGSFVNMNLVVVFVAITAENTGVSILSPSFNTALTTPSSTLIFENGWLNESIKYVPLYPYCTDE